MKSEEPIKNTFDTLSEISGIHTSEIKDIAKQVRANQEKLNSCSFHIFKSTEYKNIRKFMCENCKGTVNFMQKVWYEKGIEHSQKGDNKMKWSEFKKMIDDIIENENEDENKDPKVCSITLNSDFNKTLIIHIEDGELEIF